MKVHGKGDSAEAGHSESSIGSPPLAVVTGTDQGPGRALARYLAGEGYDLIVTARGEFDRRLIEDRLTSIGVHVWAYAGDVADPELRQRIVDVVAGRGRLELLVHHARELGLPPLPRLVECPPEELERIFRVNVVAPFALVQSLVPYLRSAGGRVVSLVSEPPTDLPFGAGAYGSSEAAFGWIIAVLARELDRERISVVAVDPGESGRGAPTGDASDRTLAFWAWLLQQEPRDIAGRRIRVEPDPDGVRTENGSAPAGSSGAPTL
jgi:NAD(P)-dependent dehydrogenase (short-subunit alcohol dehydrogenase family)